MTTISSNPTLRWATGVCAALLSSTLCLSAGAEVETKRPQLSDIPVGHIEALTTVDPPTKLRADKAPHPFVVELPEQRQKEAKQAKGKGKYKLQKQSSQSGRNFETGHRATLRAKAGDVCLSAVGAYAHRVDERDQLALNRYYEHQRIQSVRAERLIMSSRKPYLKIEDSWVDVETLDVARQTLKRVELTEIARDGEGLHIYAFRNANAVELVLHAPRSTVLGFPSGSSTPLSCGLRRVTLPLDARQGVALSFALGIPDMKADPKDEDNFSPWSNVPLKQALRVSASVSQTSRDKNPILSITLGTPARTITDALKNAMPRWQDVLGNEKAQELAQELARR